MAIGKTIGKLSIRVLPDASKFRDDLKLLIKRVETSMVANLKVAADTKGAYAEIYRLHKDAQATAINIGVNANTTIAEAQLALLGKNRTVKVRADVDQGSFAKIVAGSKGITLALSGWTLVADTIATFKKRLLALPEAVPSIAKVGLALSNLLAVGVSGIGGVATVASDLGSLVGILPALPGVLIGAGLGLTTLILAAKDGPKYLGGLKKPLSDLQQMVSTTFWAQAAGPINNLVTGLLPQLQSGFKEVSGALGSQAAAVAGAVQKALSGGVLAGWFSTVAEAMNIITPHVGAFVSAFVTLGTVGLSFMPAFAKWVGQIGEDFNAWVQAAASGGQFTTWVATAVGSMQSLFRIAGSLIGIVGAINTAATAAGGNGLATMATTLERIQSVLVSGPVQAGLTALFAGAGAGVSSLTDGIVAALDSLGGLAPTLGTVLSIAGATLGQFVADIGAALNQPAIKKGLVDFFSGLQSGLGVVGQVLPSVALVIGHLLTALGTAFSTFGPLLAAIKETFAPKLVIMADAANDLIPILGTALTGAVKALQPPLEFVFGIIADNLPFFEGLVVVLGAGALAFQAITTVTKLYSAAVAIVKGVQLGLVAATYGATGATYALTGAQKAGVLIGKAVQLAQALVSGALYNQVAALVSTAAAWVAQKAKILAASVATTAGVLLDLAKQGAAFLAQKAVMVGSLVAWAAVKGAQLAGAAATGIATAAQWLFNAALSANPIALIVIAIAALVAGLIFFFTQTKLGQEIWAGFVSFLTAAWAGLVSVATTVFTALGSFFTGLWNGIVAGVTGAWNAIVTWVSDAVAKVSTVVTTTLALLALGWSAIWEGVGLVIRTVWDAITGFVSGAIKNVQDTIARVIALIVLGWQLQWTAVSNFLSAVWNGITSFVGGAIRGVQSVITTVIGAIRSTWETVWGAISAFVSGIWTKITGFVSTGIEGAKSTLSAGIRAAKAVWETVWSGITDAVSNAWSGISGFVGKIVGGIKGLIGDVKSTLGDLPGIVKDAFTNAGTWLLNAGKAIIQGLIDGITAMIGAARTAAGNVMDAIARFFPHSPAPEGPFSGHGYTTYSGQAMGRDLAAGMDSTVSRVRRSALSLMSAASAGTATIGFAGGVEPSAAVVNGGRGGDININGNVGWQPEELLREREIRQRQQQMAYGIDGLAQLA